MEEMAPLLLDENSIRDRSKSGRTAAYKDGIFESLWQRKDDRGGEGENYKDVLQSRLCG
jgi:hypothetical protein